MPSDSLNQKIILIGEHDETRVIWLRSILKGAGLDKLAFARDGDQFLTDLRLCQRNIEHLGVIILNPNLPGVDLAAICSAILHCQEDKGVPIVLSIDNSTDADILSNSGLAELIQNGFNVIPLRQDAVDWVPTVNLCLLLRTERYARYSSEDQLRSELSDRKIMEARLQYLVDHDELTGLANRRSLEMKLEVALRRCHDFSQAAALLYLDLDRFNLINDLEGHETGDRLLVEVVGILEKIIANDQFIARIGADEFCVLLNGFELQEALAAAESVRKALDGFQFFSGPEQYHISVSIGLAMIDASGSLNHAAEVITRAHQACYVAKSNGRNQVHAYNDRDKAVYTRESDILWVSLLRQALAENRFFMVYQPVVRVSDGRITHYEALLRMRGGHGEVFLPGEFIPVAERMGLIHHIDLWVVAHTIDFLAALGEDQRDICLTINLSCHAFHERSLITLIQNKLFATGVSPSRITIEITETATVDNHQQTREMIARIRDLGCCFALDDFGSGFSSFDYIKKFPVDYLKIDGQFILNLMDDETDQVLVKAMIDISRRLGKKTVAEFVESVPVFGLLRRMGVDFVQGYLLGRPEQQLLPSRTIALPELKEIAHHYRLVQTS